MISTYVPYLAKHVSGWTGNTSHTWSSSRSLPCACFFLFLFLLARICWFFSRPPSYTSRHLKRKPALDPPRFWWKNRFWKRNKYLGPPLSPFEPSERVFDQDIFSFSQNIFSFFFFLKIISLFVKYFLFFLIFCCFLLFFVVFLVVFLSNINGIPINTWNIDDFVVFS